MALIRSAQAGMVARDAIVLDLGDLHRQGQALIECARREAERIVREAHEERQRLVDGASEEGRRAGFEQGRQAGLQQGLAEGSARALAERREVLETLEQSWTEALSSFAEERQRLLREARLDVLNLGILIAEKVVKRTVLIDPTVVESQIEAVIRAVTSTTRLVLSVHPSDLDAATQALPKLFASQEGSEDVQIVADETLSRGSCVARRSVGANGGTVSEIDARIETQLDRIVRELLPQRPRRKAPVLRSPSDERSAGEAA